MEQTFHQSSDIDIVHTLLQFSECVLLENAGPVKRLIEGKKVTEAATKPYVCMPKIILLNPPNTKTTKTLRLGVEKKRYKSFMYLCIYI